MRRQGDFFPVRRGQEGMIPGSAAGGGPSSLFSSSPWQMMRRMQEDMDRLFSEFFGPTGITGMPTRMPVSTGMQTWAPNVDISQRGNEFCIEAELPGVRQEDVDVEIRDHNLVIRAEMRQEEEEQPQQGARQYYHRERRYGYFERAIPLPENVDEENIRSTFRNGVLSITAPMLQPMRPQGRKIPVTAGAEEPSLAGAKGGEAGAAPSQTGENLQAQEGQQGQSESSQERGSKKK